MPLYDFDCESCNTPFEALVATDSPAACPQCGSERTHRRWSPIASITSPLRITGRRAPTSGSYRKDPSKKTGGD
jgi:putative FmdB family regulatory protein